MQWLVDDLGQVLGVASGGIPSNLVAVAGVEASDRDLVYFDGTEVVLRPSKPDGAVWAIATNEWIIPMPFAVAPAPSLNWVGLEAAMRGSDIFATAWNAANQTVRANAAFTLLMAELGSTRNLEGFVFAFSQSRAAMREQNSVTDFSTDQLESIGEALSENGFNPEIFDLAA
jgi:hypothetical protein